MGQLALKRLLTSEAASLANNVAGQHMAIRPSSPSDISQSKLNATARRLNERPRETLGFETPAERFAQCVASIG